MRFDDEPPPWSRLWSSLSSLDKWETILLFCALIIPAFLVLTHLID